MAFSSLPFMFVFLPLALLFYYLTPKKFRNYTLLFESLLFYALGSLDYLLILISMIFVNYFCGLFISNSKTEILRKASLGLGILANVSVLGYYKYFDFFIQNINKYFHSQIDLIHVILPIGISFYTFMAISYLFDVYQNEAKAQKNPFKLALFLSMFTNIMAGPINRYKDLIPQIDGRKENIEDFIYGLKRFVVGLGKKVLIADVLGEVANSVFALQASELGMLISWIGILAYSLQLYFDFSGYSDMALGVARLFGFRIIENFNFPYVSKTFTEFWRRWHISLSSWFRNYLYIPLGGNRAGKVRTYANLFVVFFVTGFWHGASWAYIFWGLYHGFFMIIERYFNLARKEFTKKWQNVALHIYCMFFVALGWVFFRAEDFSYALKYIVSMFDFSTLLNSISRVGEFVDTYTVLIFVLAFVGASGILKNIIEWGEGNNYKKMTLNLYLLALLYYSWCSLAASTFTPFVYFKF